MEANTNTLSLYRLPMLNLTKTLEKEMEFIKQAQLNIIKQYNEAIAVALTFPLTEFIENVRTSQEVLAKSLLRAVNPLAFIDYPETEVFEAEIVENDNLFNLSMSIEGRFYWEHSLVNTISTNSKHGKLLKMLLEADDNYVTDETITNSLDVSKDKGVGYLRRDMKKALKEFGLKADLYREKEKGYRLLGIKKLPN